MSDGATPIPRYPLRTKLIIVAVLVVAGGGFALAAMTADTDPDPGVIQSGQPGAANIGGEAPAIVERYIPGRGVEAFTQQAVGLDLSPGWSVSAFTLNDVSIPLDEIDQTPEIGLFEYRPADDKTLTALQPGTNCAAAVVFNFELGDQSTRTERWCFEVT